MKIKILAAGLLGLISATAFAQKGELTSAADNFKKVQVFKSMGPANVAPVLKTAKESIDKASVNDKTATLPQTYALKAGIYAYIASSDSTATTAFATAEEALKKAKEADTKGEFKDLISGASTDLAQAKLSQGVKEYKAGKFEMAYNSFDKYRQIMPEDTNALYFTGLSAYNYKNYDAALTNYNKLVTTKYSNSANIYFNMSDIYLAKKDTADAMKSVSDGIAKYPTSADLRKRQIELYLKTGRQQEVITLIQSAIANDPKNKTLYYYGGFTYTQLGDQIDITQKKTKAQADKDKLEQPKLDNYAKATELYKKALEIDPNFYEANLNIGYVLMKPGIDAYNDAQQLPTSKQKEYDAAVVRSDAELLDLAKPYILKAIEQNPKSVDALFNLKTYYLGKKDMANANDTQKKIDALK